MEASILMAILWSGWRRDFGVGLVAAGLTAAVLAPLGEAALRDERDRGVKARDAAQQALRLAEERAEQQHHLAQDNLVAQARDAYLEFGGADRAGAEILTVTTDALVPEVPQGARLLIDRKGTTYAAGDIVVYRNDGKNFIGRVLAVDYATGWLTIGRNREENRTVPVGDVLGRGVLNTR